MNFTQTFRMPGDDEFEEEPEDEMASAGMHVVEKDEDVEDDDATKVPEEDGLTEVEDADGEKEEEGEKEKNEDGADEVPDGLAELEELAKEKIDVPLTIDNYDE